jgi:DNA recombination protein RmuC
MPALAELQQAVQQIRVEQQGDSGHLRGLVEGVVSKQEQLARQTGLLSEALRRTGVRGQWGESTLRHVVEASGLAEHFDFDTQTHIAGDGERSAARPDLVVHLPGGGCVPVDAKVPLDAYLDAAGADTQAPVSIRWMSTSSRSARRFASSRPRRTGPASSARPRWS